MKKVRRNRAWPFVLLTGGALMIEAMAGNMGTPNTEVSSELYLEVVRAFGDTMLERGRDVYGADHTPLFVDGLHAETYQPAIWMGRDGAWVLSNFANQQALMRFLDGLTTVTGEARYRDAAEEAARYVLANLRTPNGLLHWGGHRAWDLVSGRPVGYGSPTHEMKTYQPYYELMWRVDPGAAKKLTETIWAAHIIDWPLLDYNRHASSITADLSPKWDAEFNDRTEVPWLAAQRHLSFANVTPPLVQAGGSLFFHESDESALQWTRRLVYRWQEAKHPETGLSGGQLSYWTSEMGCRAQQGFGHLHPHIHEAMMVATYHRRSRYHDIPLVQMQLGEELLRGEERHASFGKELIDWAVDDLKAYAAYAYDAESHTFRSLLTDGTVLEWEKVRPGYYRDHLSSLGPAEVEGRIFWSFAKAYRLSEDPDLWEWVRNLTAALNFGDAGARDGTGRSLSFDPASSRHKGPRDRDGGASGIYGLLELYRATGDTAFLGLAAKVADQVIASHFRNGLFPRRGRDYARTGDEIPLALLHLVAAIEGKSDRIPVDKLDTQFFHDRYYGPLAPHQRKPGDARTMDNFVFFDPLPDDSEGVQW